MTEAHGQGHGGQQGDDHQKYFYFVDDKKYDYESASITGAQIRARIPGLDASFQLFLEGHAGQADTPVGPSTAVTLSPEAEGAPRLYTAPPATFGT